MEEAWEEWKLQEVQEEEVKNNSKLVLLQEQTGVEEQEVQEEVQEEEVKPSRKLVQV